MFYLDQNLPSREVKSRIKGICYIDHDRYRVGRFCHELIMEIPLTKTLQRVEIDRFKCAEEGTG
jgi:hypothetical protein